MTFWEMIHWERISCEGKGEKRFTCLDLCTFYHPPHYLQLGVKPQAIGVRSVALSLLCAFIFESFTFLFCFFRVLTCANYL